MHGLRDFVVLIIIWEFPQRLYGDVTRSIGFDRGRGLPEAAMPWGGCFWVIRVILFRLQVLMLITTLMVVNGWHSLDSLAKGGIELRARECKYRFLAVCWHHVATTNFILSQAMQNMFSRHHGLPIGLSTTFFQSFNFFFLFSFIIFFLLISHNTQVSPLY